MVLIKVRAQTTWASDLGSQLVQKRRMGLYGGPMWMVRVRSQTMHLKIVLLRAVNLFVVRGMRRVRRCEVFVRYLHTSPSSSRSRMYE